jgi:hypothetical protein
MSATARSDSEDSTPDVVKGALVRLIAAGRDTRALAEQLQAAQRERDEAILAAWSLGVAASAIAEKAGVTPARVQQIADAAGAAPRHQNRPLSRTLEQMAPIPEAHLPRQLINQHDPSQILVWTMAQHSARTWTPQQLEEELNRQGWPPDTQVEARLEGLVDRRKIHRIGVSIYQLHEP